MTERKLQGRSGERDVMASAYRLDSANLVHDIRGRRDVVVLGAFDCPGGEDAGVIRAAEHNADVALLAKRQEVVQRALLQQRVAAGKQKEDEGPGRGELHADIN